MVTIIISIIQARDKETFAHFHKTVMTWETVVTTGILGALDALHN